MSSVQEHHYVDVPEHLSRAAEALVAGKVLAHAFGNFYVITTRPDGSIVRRVNVMKGRPPDQVGSVLTTRRHLEDLFDWSRLPAGLDAKRVRALIDDCFERGPAGFRGPAASHMPDHLTSPDNGVRTTQLIAPGYRCTSNQLLEAAIDRLPVRYLYVTSANRSRHQTGAEDEPAHFEAEGLKAEFGHEPDFHLLRHRDEAAARAAYPAYAPMSTTILAFHKLATGERGRPALIVERHGSLPIDDLRTVVAAHGFDIVPGPKAVQRLAQRAPISSVLERALA